MELEDPWHGRWIFSGLPGSLLEALEDALDLFLGRADGDQAVAEAPGLFGGPRPRGGDVDGRRLLRHGPEPHGLHLVVLAVVLDVLAGKEFSDDLDRFEHSVDALRDLRPVGGDEVLVERLAGSQAEPETAGVHRAHGGR